MQEIDIIILSSAKTPELRSMTCQAIETLLASEDSSRIRFLVQIFESAKTAPYEYPNCTTVFPSIPFNYNCYMNLGIKRGRAPWVCLCNNDLLFHPGWATALLSAMRKYPDLESASPLCEINHRERGIFPDTGTYMGYEVRKHVAGWCLFFKRSMLKKTGLLDERFKFWYADNDYAKTLEKLKVLHALVSDAKVDHLESQTLQTRTAKEQLMLTTDERFLYECKWGGRSYFSYLNYRRKQLFRKK
ncbi:glycosyltransferase [Algoriphagus sp. H41]|uniref:Glycosyltransferase n=1 Tax=Algoriphagus oliviformis TaxID=2811231 RepID=A0ABS3C6P7_9BACT|nr:glycosyltransferase [Algoriphagus oliviformis]MBN7812797.1 glycosyltransferase [Algoriphagus oliviformis]